MALSLNSDSFASLKRFKKVVEKAIGREISDLKRSGLADAYEYALQSGGKRLRPILVLMIAEALGKSKNATYAALAVEFFHTSSLILDDLPCMDNESLRRNRPVTHKVFGEATALLASYALVAGGYEMIYKNTIVAKEEGAANASELCFLALGVLSRCSGTSGATYGQYLDLNPPDNSLDTLYQIIYGKTITLFEAAFTLGWLFGGGDLALLGSVSRCAGHFGMAFQIADDFLDVEQDSQSNKAKNIVCFLGEKKAAELLDQELRLFEQLLKEVGLMTQAFRQLAKLLQRYAQKK